MIEQSKLRPDILARACEACGRPIDVAVNSVLTFFRGEFIRLHEECADDFIHGRPAALSDQHGAEAAGSDKPKS